MNILFWLVLNLGVPVIGPVFTLALIAPAYGVDVAKKLIAESVKDGQLLWSAVALSAAAIYEAVNALNDASKSSDVLAGIIVIFCLIAFASSVMVTAATIRAQMPNAPFGVPLSERFPSDVDVLQARMEKRRMLRLSIFVIGLVCVISSFLRIYIR